MTEDEKQRDRAIKAEVSEYLAGVNFDSYGLGDIDPRLDVYCRGVADAPEEHGMYEQLQLRRFLQRLNKYDFRIDEVQKFFKFYEFLKFDGTKGRQRYKLTPVQTYLFSNVYGFYEDDTHRLVNDVIWMIARKFSKTTSVTAIAIYDYLFGDDNAQVYTAANTFPQAKICYDEICKVLKCSIDPGLKRMKTLRDTIKWKKSEKRNSSITCVANSPDKLDGGNSSTNIFDEFSQADDNELYGVLTSSMGVRENPLNVIITTGSDKVNGPFYGMVENAKAILRGELPDNPHRFDALFLPDVGDAEDSLVTWRKANPHIGITVRESFLEKEWTKAQESAEKMKNFRVKYLNLFDTGSNHQWINGKVIRDHARKIDIDKVGFMDCHVGVDLSATNDLSAVAYHVYLYEEKKSHIHVDLYFPEGKMAQHPNCKIYEKWVEKGWLKLCKGDIIDYDQIAMDILEHGKHLHVMKIALDPNRAEEFRNIIIATGGKEYLYDYKQTNYYFTKPVEGMERALAKNVMSFNDNPAVAWCFDNCTLDVDNMENCKPMKGNGENGKIDGAIAALQAYGVAMQQVRR